MNVKIIVYAFAVCLAGGAIADFSINLNAKGAWPHLTLLLHKLLRKR